MIPLHVVPIALLLIGAALAAWGVLRYRRLGRRHAEATSRWIKGSATVIEARVLERERTDSNDHSYVSYEPRLRYSYAVSGVTHEGQQVALCGAPTFNSEGPASEWLSRHQEGTAIDVWYDPAQPSESAPLLDRPSLLGATVTVIAGLVLAGLAGMMLGAPL